jgi:hypothetical protein
VLSNVKKQKMIHGAHVSKLFSYNGLQPRFWGAGRQAPFGL